MRAADRRAGWLALDALAVLAFAAVGRTSHAEDLAGTLVTAAPFLAGAAVGVLAGRTWRAPLGWRAGLATWAGAVVVGLALRAAVTERLPVAFVLVAAVSLGVLTLGWRGAVWAVTRAVTRLAARSAARSRVGA